MAVVAHRPTGYPTGNSPRSAKTFLVVNVAFRARGKPPSSAIPAG